MLLTNQNAEIVVRILLRKETFALESLHYYYRLHQVKPGKLWLHKVKIIVLFTLDTVDYKMVVAK